MTTGFAAVLDRREQRMQVHGASSLPQAASSSTEMSAPAMNVLPAPIMTTAAI